MKITRFEDIVAWQEARKLGQIATRIMQDRRRFDDPCLVQQIRNCADSAMANIVEGYDSGSDKEFNRFLKIAYRSVSEIQSHFYFALDSHFLEQAEFDEVYEQARLTKSQIGGFMRYLKRPRPVPALPRPESQDPKSGTPPDLDHGLRTPDHQGP